MKWLAGFLLLFNAGLFLWATGHDPDRSSPAGGYPVVNAEGMRLLSEVGPEDASAPDVGRGCVRIGPFSSSAVASLAAQKLDAMSIRYSRRTVGSREIRAYRVFLGPFESDSAMDVQRRLLESGGVEDYYVKPGSDGSGGIISLGLFSQRDGAEVMRRNLADDNIDARLRTEERVLEPNFWLEVDDPAVSGGTPRELAEASWGENDVRVRRYQCQ